MSTLLVSSVDTWSSVFKEFGYCSWVLTLTLLGVDIYHLILWSLATDLICRHFLSVCMKFCHWSQVSTLFHQVLTFLVCLHEFWLLISGVDTRHLFLQVSTLRFPIFESLSSDFRCRHFYVGCRHLSPECISLNSLLIWHRCTSWSSRFLSNECVWSSLTLFHWDLWFLLFVQDFIWI